ncbi:hypothetical protein ABENE_13970 [Asticcacaulis benevestitus DSM 16100 = ATCC BAA-896]|uniref:Uncharacterized protein n=1 Tax=Asticcacaulis benevestitus DSM 16100 = ATCC BAA-896 TaxID=1121022 RepID=V4P694_9CAUL|nr:hypothetical protein ABENE_13970 [Asticcacaulis benevestitus DSM 16100 = ATCC BAA-896]
MKSVTAVHGRDDHATKTSASAEHLEHLSKAVRTAPPDGTAKRGLARQDPRAAWGTLTCRSAALHGKIPILSTTKMGG